MESDSIRVSVLVLTKNEQQDLPGCLESLKWSDDIHVLDSCSTDQTTEIVRSFGAQLVIREFDNWASHQNWALKNINFKYEWVYYSDADERMTPELLMEIKNSVARPEGCVAFRVRRRDYLNGVWLKHVTPSPFNIRLFIPGFISYEREVNPFVRVNGNVGEIDAHFDHFSFSKGFDHWFDKHNKYSAAEARQILKNRGTLVEWSFVSCFFEKDRNVRRFHQKELFYRLPGRPAVKFIWLYFLRRGFLDGYSGFVYAILQSIYEYMIVLKVKEYSNPGMHLIKK